MHGRRHVLPSTRAGATQTRPSSCSACTRAALCASGSEARGEVTERDDRQRRRPAQGLELGPRLDLRVQEPRLGEVARDRGAKRGCAVGAEGEPQLERPERPGVLERDVDRVRLVPLVREVVLLVRERRREVGAPSDEHDAARLRQVEPLVRVDGRRVGTIEAGEERGRLGHRRRRQAVRAVDVQPDAALGADVGESVERVDSAR